MPKIIRWLFLKCSDHSGIRSLSLYMFSLISINNVFRFSTRIIAFVFANLIMSNSYTKKILRERECYKGEFLVSSSIKSSTNFSHARWFVSWQFFNLWVLRWQIASFKRKLNAQVSDDIFDMWKWSIFDTCGFSFLINWSICLVAFFVQIILFLLFSQNCYFWRQSELRWSWI